MHVKTHGSETGEIAIYDYKGRKAAILFTGELQEGDNTIAMVRSWSQMNSVADENGFIVVYPQGIDCWNCGFTISSCTTADDDVGFLRAVVSEVQKNACIDPKRVYATGVSNGSM